MERLANQFTNAWQRGERPTIESFLEQADVESRPPLLTELIKIEIAARQRAGETPTASEYLAHFPDHRARLEGFFAALNLFGRSTLEVDLHATVGHVDSSGTSIGQLVGHSAIGAHGLKVRCPHCHNPIELVDSDSLQELTCPSCGSNFSLVEGQSTSTYAQPTVKRLGHFELVEQLGMGAFGSVWKARDTELHREVAIKIPRKDRLHPEETEKFFREARAAAQLRHPSIVSVHEVGRDGDTVYIVSDLVRGVTLSDWLSGQQPTPREAAELCAQVAEALQHAHEQGVIHRDLKPGNIMLDAEGRPHIMDFGLAKREAGEITMTVEGQVLGTPAYMSPEQARGEGHAVDRRTDIYSLGVILFQLLTGELPFRGTPRMLLHQVLNEEPRSPRSLNDRVPRDLETICLKAMAKEPARRYPTAEDLFADLQRYLKGEPILARPIGRLERGGRWISRNPVVASLTAAVSAAILLGTSATAYYAAESAKSATDARRSQQVAEQRAQDVELQRDAAAESARAERIAREEAELARAQADQQQDRADRLQYVSFITRAQTHLESNKPELALEALDACRQDLRNWEHDFLYNELTRGQTTLKGHAQPVMSVAFSPDGMLVASASSDKTLRVWNTKTRRQAFTLKGHAGEVMSLAFSPDGKRIASGSQDNTVKLWDVTTGQELLSLKGHTNWVWSVAFSPDGRQIASGSHDTTVKVWDTTTGEETLTLKGHSGAVDCVVFSPVGKWIASGGHDNTVKVWDAMSGREWLTFKEHTHWVWSLAFSPDGRRIASGTQDSVVKVWDAMSGQNSFSLTHPMGVTSVAFSPDGTRIVTGSHDKIVRVWSLTSGQETLTLKGHSAEVMSVAFSTDGNRIASGSKDNLVKLWDVTTSQELLALKGHTGGVEGLAFSPDGSQIASGSWDRSVKVWDATSGQETLTLNGHTAGVMSVAFSPDGKRIASGSKDNTVQLWDVTTRQAIHTLRAHTDAVWSVAFSPDGLQIASASEDRTVRVWDATTAEETFALKGHTDRVISVAFSPDGKWLVSASHDMTIKLWDAQAGLEVRTFKGHTDGVECVAFSFDGQRIASASLDHTVKVWDATTGQESSTLKGHTDKVMGVVFSPDGQRIVSGGWDKTVKIWDAMTGQETVTLKGYWGPVDCVVFSPNGKQIASGCKDNTVKVWDASRSMPRSPAE